MVSAGPAQPARPNARRASTATSPIQVIVVASPRLKAAIKVSNDWGESELMTISPRLVPTAQVSMLSIFPWRICSNCASWAARSS